MHVSPGRGQDPCSVMLYLVSSRVTQQVWKDDRVKSLLESVRHNLGINIIWNLLDNANSDGFDEVGIELRERSQDLVGAAFVLVIVKVLFQFRVILTWATAEFGIA